MERSVSKLTVLFDDPFWVGIYERECGGKYEVCKITFGAEPSDGEVYEMFLTGFNRLQFSNPVADVKIEQKNINPKRMQREINKELHGSTGIGTKAQQAIKLQQESAKLEHKSNRHERREAENERRFELRCEKRKEKHRGH